jgi:hypothetical protein
MRDKVLSSTGKSARALAVLFAYAAVSTILANALIATIDATPWSADAALLDAIAVSAKYISVPIASLVLAFLAPHVNPKGPSLFLLACRGFIAPLVQIAGFLCIATAKGVIHDLTVSDVARVYWSMTSYRFGSLFAGNMIGQCLWQSRRAAGKWLDRNVRLHLRACTGIMVSLVFSCLYDNRSMTQAIRQSIGTPYDFLRGQVKATVIDDYVTHFVGIFDTTKG